MDNRPEDYSDPHRWFLYFRVTKSLPAIPRKFEEEMARVTAAPDAHVVMTAYAATAIDTLCHLGVEGKEFPEMMRDWFELEPTHLLQLNVRAIEAIVNYLPDGLPARFQKNIQVIEKLSEAGYTIEDGIIARFSPRLEITPPPRQKPASGPKP